MTAGSVDSVLNELLSTAALAAGCPRSIVLLCQAESRVFRAAASYGLPESDRDRLARTERSKLLDMHALEKLMRERRAVVLGENGGGDAAGPNVVAPLLGPHDELLGLFAVWMEDPKPGKLETLDALARAAAGVLREGPEIGPRSEQSRRSQALLDMFQQMTSSVALPQVLAGICRKTVENFDVAAATIFDCAGGEFVQTANYGMSPEVAERYVRFRYTPGLLPHHEEIAAGRSVVICRDDAPAQDVREWLDALRLFGTALFPLRAGEHLYGLLAVGIREPRAFLPSQVLDIELVARHATTAMAFARFLHGAESEARFRAAVSALAVQLSAETERARALHVLCERGRVIFRAGWAALFLPQGERLVEVAADGDVEGESGALSVARDDRANVVARAFGSGEVVLDKPADVRSRSGATLAIPLASSEGPMGVMVFRGLRDPQMLGVAGEARILGALAAAVLRNLDLLHRLNNANTELRRANIMKDQLLANASHDLRTPLNVIIGYGQLALEGAFGEAPPELQGIIERMVSSACDQLTLVEDLLNLSRIELNILTVKPMHIPLRPLFREMQFVLESLVQNKSVAPVVENVSDDLWVVADPDRLRQILTNLLGNAAKFTEHGSIELRAIPEETRVRIAVRDSGIGIAPEHHQAIFEPFCQIDEKRAPSGAGLGLAIARRLTNNMNGTLTVESRLGEGSTFWLTLPRGNPRPEGANDAGNGKGKGGGRKKLANP